MFESLPEVVPKVVPKVEPPDTPTALEKLAYGIKKEEKTPERKPSHVAIASLPKAFGRKKKGKINATKYDVRI